MSDVAVRAPLKGLEFYTYTKAGMGAGNNANNPWTYELPDPVTRLSWDNYVVMSAADAVAYGVEVKAQSNGSMNGNTINITVDGTTLENVPVWIQPGQTQGSIGLAVGFGRTEAGKVGNNVGVNANSLLAPAVSYAEATVVATEVEHGFASVQLAHTMMGRKIVNEINLPTFLSGNAKEWNEKPTFESYKGPLTSFEANLWDDQDHETSHMWNMSIDLNSCTGCGACVVACSLENNVPVVGKDEVRRHRDMHWLRIDRYYSSDMTKEVAEEEGVGAIEKYAKMEVPSESPSVVFQPVMCQHCNHAPCETVCPVGATVHSREGLNHMAYNRCIGTRYCANNCPYKVRRFNWFNYQVNDKFTDVNPSQDDYGRMVLNPDVTVRARGVIEKCSLCIQRIQLGKLEAKKDGRQLTDGEFTTACAQACGSGAIVFGDVNNPKSEVSHLKQEERAYHLLEEVGTQPSIFYQTKVRNRA
jgi:molybdopterin-containing oxidoreductase family iron-sulfur binding subunit